MIRPAGCAIITAVLATAAAAADSSRTTLRVGVVQTVLEDTLAKNEAKFLRFIREAKDAGCQLAAFPESGLYDSAIATDKATKAGLDAANARIGAAARAAGLAIVFGTCSRATDRGAYEDRAMAYDAEGSKLVDYIKNRDVPGRFFVQGVPCSVDICSDRWYLELSDLPAVVQDVKVIVEISGGHGGDDGRPALRWIRYQPWAVRTGAYVIVSNPVHNNTDFMGNSPWGGGSAIIRPDGSIQAARTHEQEVLIVEDLDLTLATRGEADRRRNHPLFREFWDLGERLLNGKAIDPVPEVAPHRSAVRDIKIAAAQIACSGRIAENLRTVLAAIGEAARQGADVVVFPELALTGSRREDVLAAEASALDRALRKIQDAARAGRIYAIVGMPTFVDGSRRNSAFVIGDDGAVRTRYDQITARGELFQPGTSTKAMWFTLKGVHSIVTIGSDAGWVEIGDMAASRGMCLRFHIGNQRDASTDFALMRKQENLTALSYAQFGAAVNAASGGGSLITSREGGHAKPAPAGLEHYLPYQTSVVSSAGPAEATILYTTRRTEALNSHDLNRYWINRNRKRRAEPTWYDWVKAGAWLIDAESPQ